MLDMPAARHRLPYRDRAGTPLTGIVVGSAISLLIWGGVVGIVLAVS